MQCYKCGKENLPGISFCIECGNQLRGEKIDYNDVNKKYFTQSILLFFAVVLVIILSGQSITGISFLEHEYIINGLLVLITLAFIVLDFKGFVKIIHLPTRIKPLIAILLGAPVLALIVYYLAQYLNHAIGMEVSSYFESYQEYTSHMYLYGILFVSLAPGFIEEFLFRGILFNHLLRLTSPKATILISSILFAFIHFSIFSLVWLLAIGLILGYLRFRYRTIWYGILFHAWYNACIFLMEIYLKSS